MLYDGVRTKKQAAQKWMDICQIAATPRHLPHSTHPQTDEQSLLLI